MPPGTEDVFPRMATLRDGEAVHIERWDRRYWYAHQPRNIRRVSVEAAR